MNFTLPRLFRNPAISNFFPFPLGLRNSGVRLYFHAKKIWCMSVFSIVETNPFFYKHYQSNFVQNLGFNAFSYVSGTAPNVMM